MINWEMTEGKTAVLVSCWEEARELIDAAIGDRPDVNDCWRHGHDKEWYDDYTDNNCNKIAFQTNWEKPRANMTYTNLEYFIEEGYTIISYQDIIDNDDLNEIATPISSLFE